MYQLQKLLCNYIQLSCPGISNIQYFSDGCLAQHKNYKNLLNLTFHKQDFGFDAAVWNFFATSHGKSPCNGLGGTIKRKLTTESLSRTKTSPIVTALQAYECCKNTMPIVEFFFVPKDDLTEVCTKLKTRYAYGHTVPGTRSYLVFIPKNVGILSFKKIGENEETSGQHSFFQAKQTFVIPNIKDYVIVKHEGHWWIGLVIAVENISMEAKIKFMSPHGPRKNFF